MESSAYFLNKAGQCHRLALALLVKNDAAIETLMDLAGEFERQAMVAATRERNAPARRPNGKDESARNSALKNGGAWHVAGPCRRSD
jgi:hypothetical protein